MRSAMIPIGKIGNFLGYDLNPATGHRWRVKGILHNGRRIRLAAQRIGARYYVSEEDLRAFIAALNSSNNESSQQNSIHPVSISATDADKLLDDFGV